ncbi:MAG TPA: hypothetical protein DEB06_06015 [Phycisphaerales bacterium]|nr:hypothetical protein [Phycisphaerales bacterium]
MLNSNDADSADHRADERILWARAAGVLALAAAGLYLFVVLVRLPGFVDRPLSFALGPLMALGSYAGARALTLQRRNLAAELGGVAGVIAGAMHNAMMVVQQTMFAFAGRAIRAAESDEAREALRTAYRATNSVQLGLDIAWDGLIGVSTALFGVALLKWGRKSAAYGVLGVLVALAFYSNNMVTFPTPPADGGSIDLGPLAGFWFLGFGIILWFRFGRRPKS